MSIIFGFLATRIETEMKTHLHYRSRGIARYARRKAASSKVHVGFNEQDNAYKNIDESFRPVELARDSYKLTGRKKCAENKPGKRMCVRNVSTETCYAS